MAMSTPELRLAADGGRQESVNTPSLVPRLYVQLLNGCGNNTCKEPFCLTGLRNRSPPNRPFRPWTPRSARAIVIALASSKTPMKHLCNFCPGLAEHEQIVTGAKDSPRDPTSMQQALCDTSIVQNLCGGFSIAGSRAPYASLSRSLASLLRPVSIESTVPSNAVVAGVLANAIRRLLRDIPVGTHEDHEKLRIMIDGGSAVPRYAPDFGTGPQMPAILDALADRARMNIMTQICAIISFRSQLELGLQASQIKAGIRGVDQSERKLLVLLCSKLLEPVMLPHARMLMFLLQNVFLSRYDDSLSITDPESLAALTLIEVLYPRWLVLCTWPLGVPGPVVPASILSGRKLTDIAKSWLERSSGRHVLSFRHSAIPQEQATYFRAINHIRMQKAHSSADKHVKLRGRMIGLVSEEAAQSQQIRFNEEHYLLLNVSRGNILRDTFDQLWQRRSAELLRPLRVRLGEIDELEVGQDLGGVQIEFFNLVCKEIFAEEAGMFAALEEATGMHYFRPGSLQPLYMFELFGVIIALALYNGITLPINMPLTFYNILLHDVKRLSYFSGDSAAYIGMLDGWPTQARSLRWVMDSPTGSEGLEYSFPLEANGMRLSAQIPLTDGELKIVESSPPWTEAVLHWPGWKITQNYVGAEPVGEGDKAKYVRDYAHWLTYYSVLPQLQAFKSGFEKLFDHRMTSLFDVESLKSCLEGEDDLDMKELRVATQYSGYWVHEPYMQSFWNVVERWSQEKQKKLLKFVTAAERVPVGGAEHLVFVIQNVDIEDDDRLPTSSTCFGTLMLPKYSDESILDQKLTQAIEYGLEGFGTG